MFAIGCGRVQTERRYKELLRLMDVLGFTLAVLLIELTPGPNMGWLVALTLTEGRRSGLAAVTGIGLGLACNAGLSVLGATYILASNALAAQVISVFGAAMMAYLALQAWRDAGDSSPASTPDIPAHRNFAAGFIINLLNPKAALFFITVMPQFVPEGQPTYAQGLTMAAISVTIATLVHLALIVGAEHLRPLLLASSQARLVRRVLAVGMLGVGLWFLAKAFL